MPSPPRIFFHGGIFFITTSIRRGILLPPNALVREIVLKAAAHAQAKHYLKIIDIIVQPTHIHLIVQIVDPSNASDFMERFKTEVSHAINRILGRSNFPVWCESFDSPHIPDLKTLYAKIRYIYANPSNDNGEDSIDRFPGFNTFYLRELIASGQSDLKPVLIPTHVIPRTAFVPLKEVEHTPEGYIRYRDRLVQNRKEATLEISPNALFERFGITKEDEIRRHNQALIVEVRRLELQNRTAREAEGRTVIGAKQLVATPIGTPYEPERKGRRTLVHCIDKRLRLRTLKWMRELIRRGKLVQQRWRLGDYSVPYPMGLFPPTGFRLAEPIGW